MKKSFLFAAVIAMVAMVATSCNDKKPVADFTVLDDGLTVTFQNKSQNADVYAWDFGDGQTSTEKSPVHQYAEAKTYTVKLTASNKAGQDVKEKTVTLEVGEQEIIAVDGDFSDWDALPAEKIASAETDANAKYEALYKVKFAQDATNIYFYLEYNGGQEEFGDDATLADIVDAVDIFLCLDGDETTGGGVSWMFNGLGWDVDIEGHVNDNFATADVYVIPEENYGMNDDWYWTSAGIADAAETSSPVSLENGHKAIEGKIVKAVMPVAVSEVRAACFSSETVGWSETGCLPQVTITDAGETVLSDLLLVP